MIRLALALLIPALLFSTPSRLLLNADHRHDAFAAVGRLRSALTCTAFLVQPAAASPVYALTNGHCVLGVARNEVATDVPVPEDSSFTFHYFVDTASRRQSVAVRAIPYATLKGLDLAVIQLDTTWEKLASAGVRPLRLGASGPRPGASVYTIGAPVSGVPDTEAWLRRSDCNVAAIAQLAEGPWKFHDAARLSCGAAYAGASGSPVFDVESGDVAAIINTSTQGQIYSSGDIPCFTNSPCELTQPSGRLVLEAAYALPLTGVSNCFDAAGRFDLRLDSCPLDPGGDLTLSNTPFTSVLPGAAWNVGVRGSTSTHYRYKTGPEVETDCRIDTGYSEPIPLTPGARIQEPMPSTNGRYILCVLASGQQSRHATFTHTAVDSTPPVLRPQWVVRGDEDFFSVQFFFNVPDLSDYRYKYGPDAATDCDNPANYLIYRRIPIRVPIDKTSLIRFCVLGGDRAGNFTRPTHILLGESHPLPSGVVNSAGFEQGPLSPGAWASVFLASPFNNSLPPITLVDAAGTVFPLARLAGDQQVNFRIPANAAIGPAQLRFPSPIPSAFLLDIRPVSPGIFVSPDRTAWGVFRIDNTFTPFGGCAGPNNCFQVPIPVPASLSISQSGLALAGGRAITAWAAGQRLTGTVPTGGGGVIVDIPANFPYRGYVPIQLEVDGIRSNIAFIHLRDEGI